MTQTYARAGMLPGRSPVALVTVGLHVAALVLFAGAARVRLPPEPPTMTGTVIDDFQQPPVIRDAPRPRVAGGDDLLRDPLPLPPAGAIVEASLPEDPLAPPGAGDPGHGTVATEPAPAVPETPLRFRVLKSQDLFYPAASLRLGEEGSVEVRVCADAAGVVRAPPEVLRGSGHARLDAAAVAWAVEGLRYVPATRDGAPVAACKGFRVQFRLTR